MKILLLDQIIKIKNKSTKKCIDTKKHAHLFKKLLVNIADIQKKIFLKIEEINGRDDKRENNISPFKNIKKIYNLPKKHIPSLLHEHNLASKELFKKIIFQILTTIQILLLLKKKKEKSAYSNKSSYIQKYKSLS